MSLFTLAIVLAGPVASDLDGFSTLAQPRWPEWQARAYSSTSHTISPLTVIPAALLVLLQSGQDADSSAAVKALSEALTDKDAGVRKSAALSLGRLGEQAKVAEGALVKALKEFLSLVQNGFKAIDAHANDASDADYQKQIAALRARAQQHLDWGREQLAALQ